jgi:small subunit ribosomal protein S20
MPIKRAAYKQLRADKKKRFKNLSVISGIKTAVRRLNDAVSKGDEAKSRALLKEASSKLNKAVSKKVLRKNTASRKISRLSKKVSHAFKK